MDRNEFLRLTALMGSGMLLKLNGVPLHAFEGNGFLKEMAMKSMNDRILVLIQLHGGNDGLNMVLPINQYAKMRHSFIFKIHIQNNYSKESKLYPLHE